MNRILTETTNFYLSDPVSNNNEGVDLVWLN